MLINADWIVLPKNFQQYTAVENWPSLILFAKLKPMFLLEWVNCFLSGGYIDFHQITHQLPVDNRRQSNIGLPMGDLP